jgi:hypothetical protein
MQPETQGFLWRVYVQLHTCQQQRSSNCSEQALLSYNLLTPLSRSLALLHVQLPTRLCNESLVCLLKRTLIVAVVAAAIVTDRHLMIAERALPIADVMTTDHVSAEPMTTMKIDIQSADVMMTMTIANAMMIHAIGAVLVTVVEVVEVEVEVEVLVVEVLVEVLVAVVVHSKTKAKVDPSPTNDVENMVCGLL